MSASDPPGSTEVTGPDLMVLAADLAAELDDVGSAGDGGVVTYRRGGTVFARVSADALEVRLPADIADAALRTPDTAALTEGIWTGPSGGANLVAALRIARRLGPGHRSSRCSPTQV